MHAARSAAPAPPPAATPACPVRLCAGMGGLPRCKMACLVSGAGTVRLRQVMQLMGRLT